MGNMEDIDVEIMEAIKKGVKAFHNHFEEYDVTLVLRIEVEQRYVVGDGVMTRITYEEEPKTKE